MKKSEIAKRVREETKIAIYNFKQVIGREPSNDELRKLTDRVVDTVIKEYMTDRVVDTVIKEYIDANEKP